MDVDPILPPVDGSGVVSEVVLFLFYQCMRERRNIVGDKIMLVAQNKRLKQLNQLLDFFQIALCLG